MGTGKLPNHILLFDGNCLICNRAVSYVYDLDTKCIFHFASLQSQFGQQLIKNYSIKLSQANSIIYIRNKKAITHSTAVLNIAKELCWLRPLYVFVIIPKPIRDAVYNLIAKNRHKWVGRSSKCMLPSTIPKQRILN